MARSRMFRRIAIGLGGLVALGLVAVIALSILFFVRLERSKLRLAGEVRVSGLAAPVRIARDAAGVPTLTGRSRADLAYATGYLHAQERYFQMDMMRRVAAGELGALFGPAALQIDEKVRLHLFRARAHLVLSRMTPDERAIVRTYVAGVNKGLADLRAAPFEYMLLRQAPQPWTAEDSLLVVYAMYLDLQEPEPILELDRARAAARVGPAMANLLYPARQRARCAAGRQPAPAAGLAGEARGRPAGAEGQ
jgi:penicillin amidase